jgi:aryl-alcohol dehydrogenase-like predicted oxidoreductase
VITKVKPNTGKEKKIDRETPWEEISQAMETLVQQGKVIYVDWA